MRLRIIVLFIALGIAYPLEIFFGLTVYAHGFTYYSQEHSTESKVRHF